MYDGVGYAVARAAACAAEATARLARFPRSEEREVLGLIAEYVVQRDR